MGAFDDIKNKAKDAMEDAKGNLEGISDAAIEKAGDAVDSATGGKHADKVDAAQAKADDLIKGEENDQQA